MLVHRRVNPIIYLPFGDGLYIAPMVYNDLGDGLLLDIHPKRHVDMTNKDLDRRRKTGQHIEIDLAIRNKISHHKPSLAQKKKQEN